MTDPPSWISTYAPLATALAALIAAGGALIGIWWNNRHAAQRERDKHRRDSTTQHVATLLGHTEAVKAALGKIRDGSLSFADARSLIVVHLSDVTAAAQPVKLVDARLITDVDALVSACGSANSCIHKALTAEQKGKQANPQVAVEAKAKINAASTRLVSSYHTYYGPSDSREPTVSASTETARPAEN
ncbi:hypothetical protein [Tsukamurella pseudospumae]|uniref:hypothetical protein n=1 Tax=Tsukamurella pseudospumae TaxID=239498 RepID=UPI001111D92F|nr:hypothetical protein [Tsukamurella pseudospumae]